MSEPVKISFARKAGAGTSAPVAQAPAAAPAQPAPVSQAPAAAHVQPPAPTQAPAAAPVQPAAPAEASQEQTQLAVPSGVNSLGFYDGSEELPESSAADKRTPWLALIQPTTRDKTVGDENVKDGTFVYKKAVVLPQPVRAVVVGFRPKVWVEKLPYIQNPGPNDPVARVAKSLQEVAAFGGTDVWELSNANVDRRTRIPKHATPFFDPHIQALLLIEAPEGVDDSHFPIVIDGKAYGPALFEFKGTSFKTGFVPINTERGSSLQGKWCSRYVRFTSQVGRNTPAYFVVTKVIDPTSAALQDYIAKEIR